MASLDEPILGASRVVAPIPGTPEGEPLLEKVTASTRREAAALDVAGKHEPKLRENGGIPADVLAKLLPGDDILELEEPEVAGGLGYRFVKRAFDVCSCGAALVVLAIPWA